MKSPSTLLTVSLSALLSACAVVEAPSISPHLGPRSPGCWPIEVAILGSWQREGRVEEFRRNGTYLLNGHEGAYRWSAPGRAVIDAGGVHAEVLLGLTQVNELLLAGPDGVGQLYGRVSPTPPIPRHCYDLRTGLVGTWTSEGAPVTYDDDGTYRTEDESGTWSFPTDGHLSLDDGEGVADYAFAPLSDTTALSFRRVVGSRVSWLTRSP